MLLTLYQQNLSDPPAVRAWAPGSWAPGAWRGTAWASGEAAPIGTAWFATAWAPGAWGTAAWASTETAPPSPWELEQPTLGPQLEATFAASGDFVMAGSFALAQTAPASLSVTFSASGNFEITAPGAQPFDLVATGPASLSASVGVTGGVSAGDTGAHGRIIRRGRTKFPKPLPPAPEETPEAPPAPRPVSLLDTRAMELTIQQGVQVYRKKRVQELKRKIAIEKRDEESIDKALLEFW